MINYNTQISSEGTGNFNAAINNASNSHQNIFESNLKGRIRNKYHKNSIGDGSSVIYKSMGNQSMDSTTNGTQRLKTKIWSVVL